jgi:hypothetical protein
MPVPSLYPTTDSARPWNLARVAAYGAGIGAVAGLLKTFAMLHAGAAASGAVFEVLTASLAFALLCAGAAALRNYIARRVVWGE